MGRTCSICRSKQRPEIDVAIVAGESVRTIAGRYGTNRSAVQRHRDHIPAALADAKQATDGAHADDLLAKVRQLETDARRLAASAEAAGDRRTALQGIRELLRIIEFMGRRHDERDTTEGRVTDGPPTTPGTLEEAYEDIVATLEDFLRVCPNFPEALRDRMVRLGEELVALKNPQP